MKILHVTPHLGGGVGKALSTIVEHDDMEVSRFFLLLEPPRDTCYIRSIKKNGGEVFLSSDVDDKLLIQYADIIQIEWWSHPLSFEWLCRHNTSKMRTVFWSHINGLSPPYIPEALVSAADYFLFSSPCSLNIYNLKDDFKYKVGVVNSGFGFSLCENNRTYNEDIPKVGYLGSINFEKMHQSFFECIDCIQYPDFRVHFFGDVDFEKNGIIEKVRSMKYPERVCFNGFAENPEEVLRKLDVFLYLLRRDHYGTGENALAEAMSLGCVPIVLDNPSEMELVQNGITGFVVRDIQEASDVLSMLLRGRSADLEAIGQRAASAVKALRSPPSSCRKLKVVYEKIIKHPKKSVRYSDILGIKPISWFALTHGTNIRSPHDINGNRQWCYERFRRYYPDSFPE